MGSSCPTERATHYDILILFYNLDEECLCFSFSTSVVYCIVSDGVNTFLSCGETCLVDVTADYLADVLTCYGCTRRILYGDVLLKGRSDILQCIRGRQQEYVSLTIVIFTYVAPEAIVGSLTQLLPSVANIAGCKNLFALSNQ